MTAMAVETGAVSATRMADGLLVRLAGELGPDQVAEMRSALLSPLPDGCRDVVIDAGDITGMEFEALAVVFAAWAWAEQQGARFLLSRTSATFEAVLTDNGVVDDLPRLSDLRLASDAPAIPQPRSEVG